MALDFEDKIALVVDGSTGIGNAAARILLEISAAVYITGTRADPADCAGTDGGLFGLTCHQLDMGDRATSRAKRS